MSIEFAFKECTRHFAKPESAYYSLLVHYAQGGGYIIIQRSEWEKQPTDEAKKALITSRLNILYQQIQRKPNANLHS